MAAPMPLLFMRLAGLLVLAVGGAQGAASPVPAAQQPQQQQQRRLDHYSYAYGNTTALLDLPCRPRSQFTWLVFDNATLVYSNLGGQDGRCNDMCYVKPQHGLPAAREIRARALSSRRSTSRSAAGTPAVPPNKNVERASERESLGRDSVTPGRARTLCE